MATTDLGVMNYSAAITGDAGALNGMLIRHDSSNTYSIWQYWYADYFTGKMSYVILNHDTDEVTSLQTSAGRPLAKLMRHPDSGLIYLGFSCSTSAEGPFGALDFINGTYVELGTIPQIPGKSYDFIQDNTYSDETNKRVFMGTALTGALLAWDPVTESLQDYGTIGKAEGDVSYQRYIYSLQVNDAYAYCGIKQSSDYGANNAAYLSAVDLSTGNYTNIWEGTAGLNAVLVYRHSNGNIYVNTTTGILASDWWLIDPAHPTDTPTAVGSNPGCYPLGYRDNIDYTGYSCDGSLAYPDGIGGTTVTLKYKRTGDSSYREIEADIIRVTAYKIFRMHEGLENDVICCGETYSSVTRALSSDVKEQLGVVAVINPYSIAPDLFTDKIYFAGYDSGAAKYDPTSPWLWGTNPLGLTLPNPTYGKRYYQAEIGTDRNLWLNGVGTRNGVGTYFDWYDIEAGTSASLRDTDATIDWSLYEMSMGLNAAKTRFVLSMSKIDNSDSMIAVVPVWKKAITKTFRPLGVVADQGLLVSVETSLATTGHFVGITSGLNYKTYCVNIYTKQLVWGPNTITGKTSVIGPTLVNPIFAHGYVWYYEGTWIVKMDPTTGTITQVLDLSSFSTTGQMIFVDDVLYHTDATSKKLFKITGLV